MKISREEHSWLKTVHIRTLTIGGLPPTWAGDNLHILSSLEEKGLVERFSPRRHPFSSYFRVTDEGLNYLTENDQYYIRLKLEKKHKENQKWRCFKRSKMVAKTEQNNK